MRFSVVLSALLAVLVLAPAASANSRETVYQPRTSLPAELQVRILALLNSRCARGLSYNTLKEESTVVREESIDQGIRDYFYTTTFSTNYIFDGAHPVGASITVVSAEYDISNPSVDRFDIRALTGDSGICDPLQ